MADRRERRRHRRAEARTFEMLSVQGKDEDWISELREDEPPEPGPDDGEWAPVRKALDAHESALAAVADRLDAVEAALGELARRLPAEGPPPAGPHAAHTPASPTVRSVVGALRASASGSAARLAREPRVARRRTR